MSSSEDTLPSPDRVANLWRYGQTPPKLKSVSVEGAVDAEEGDLMESETDNFDGERDSHDVTLQREKLENLFESGSLKDKSAGETSGGQVEEEEEECDSNEKDLLASLEKWLEDMQSVALSQDSFHSLAQEEVSVIVEEIMRTLRKASNLEALQTVCKATLTLLDSAAPVHLKESLPGMLELLTAKGSQHPQSEEFIDAVRSKIQQMEQNSSLVSLGSSFEIVSGKQSKIGLTELDSLCSSIDQVPSATQLTLGSDFSANSAPEGELAEKAAGGDSTPPPAEAEWGGDVDDLDAILFADKKSVTEVLRQVYGKDTFRPGQLEALQAMHWEGRDVMAVFPPGHGKTLAMQLPAVYSKKVAFIVTPLTILRDTQAEEAEKRNLTCIKLGGGAKKDVEDGLSLLRNSHGKAVLVFMTPEFAVTHAHALRDALPGGLRSLSHIGIDEAHLTYEWQSFRPEYGSLGKMRSVFPGVPMMAMSATVTSEGLERIKSTLHMENCVVLRMPPDVPNVKLIVATKSGTPWGDILFACNGDPGSEPTLVYCRSKEDCRVLIKEFGAARISAVQYHGGMFEEERMAAHKQFSENKSKVMVATAAYGLGVDKPDVGRVIHYGLPGTLESYVQQIGRAGRGGQEATSCLMWSPAELQIARKTAFQPAEKTNLKHTEEYVRSTECRRKALLTRFGGHKPEGRGEGTCCDNCMTGGIWCLFSSMICMIRVSCQKKRPF